MPRQNENDMNGAWTVGATLDWTVGYFEKNLIPEARLEAELLLSHVLELPRLSLLLKKDEVVPQAKLASFKQLILERKQRKPVSYLLGEQEFMGLTFRVTPFTLIPRPETELVVEEVMKLVSRGHDGIVVDLGTGSGNIPVSIAKLSEAGTVYSVDASLSALAVAQENVNRHGVAGRVVLRQGNLFEALANDALEGKVDIVVSNPPYIATGEMEGLPPELGFEPTLALDGGADGDDFYRRIAPGSTQYLKDGGYLVLELAAARSAGIRRIVEESGFAVEKIVPDYAGLDRVLVARKAVE